MAVKRSGLGKGLNGMFPDSSKVKSEELTEKDGVVYLKLSQVEPNREQPRKNFEEDALLELSDSIKQFGVLQPIFVQKMDKYYEIIAGERRWRAAKMAGLKEIPVLIKDYTPQQVLVVSLVENIQRENLNSIEEARAYKILLEEYSLKQDEVAERVSKSRSAVTNSMRLLKLNPKVQEMVIDERISTGHARALLAIDDLEEQLSFALKASDEGLTVRDVETMVKRLKNPKKGKAAKIEEHTFVYTEFEDKLQAAMGTKVKIIPKEAGKGKIEIDFYSVDDFERIFDSIIDRKAGTS